MNKGFDIEIGNTHKKQQYLDSR